jgi:hypothetical protein
MTCIGRRNCPLGLGAPILQLRRSAYGNVQVCHQAVGKRIDSSVDGQVLTTLPGLVHEDVGRDVFYLPNDVEFA